MNRIIVLFLIASVLVSYSALAQENNLQKILSDGDRPSRQDIHVDVEDDQGNLSSLPISVIKGSKPGPTFTIISGVHGVEYSSIIASSELIQEIDPTLLSGNLIILPITNPSSFYGRTPFINPQDSLNLNRVFPGDEDGSVTEKIAHFITTSVIDVSDVFVDMHGGDANEDLLTFIGYYNNQGDQEKTSEIKRLVEASGFEYVVSWPYTLKEDQPAKYAFKQAIQDGKLAFTIEAGKLGNVQEEVVETIKDGILNVLAELDMYPADKRFDLGRIRLNQQHYIKSAHKGIFVSNYSAGERVVEGDVIGVVKNEFGGVLFELIAPSSGTILYKIGTPPVNVGETVMCIAY